MPLGNYDPNAPRKARAKRCGHCLVCDERILLDDLIYWLPRVGAWHHGCVLPPCPECGKLHAPFLVVCHDTGEATDDPNIVSNGEW